MIRRVGELETSEDLGYERREQRVQRAGWALMALLLLAAVLGLSGSGPLARATARATGFEVEYPRFARREAPGELTVRLARGTPGAVWLASELLERTDVESVTPPPLLVVPGASRVSYRFAGAGPAEIVFTLKPERSGWHRLRLGVDGGGELALGQLVYP